MRTTTLQSSKASSRLWKLFAAMLLVWLLIPVGQVSAQTRGTLKAYWKFSRPDGTHGQLNLFCAASGTEGNEITDWANPGWQTPIGFQLREIETVVIEESFKSNYPTSCKGWFKQCANLRKIEGIENLNTERVTDMSSMFEECAELKSIDLSHFDTKNVTTMEKMFHGIGASYNDFSPVKLDLSTFNTSKVENMKEMFEAAWQITSLDLRHFDMSKVTTTESMFAGCHYLASIYAYDWSNNSNITNSKGMFSGCGSLKGAIGLTDGVDIKMANGQTGYFMPTYKNDGKDTYPTVDINLASYPCGTVSLNLKNKETFEAPYPFYIDKGTYTRENMRSNWGTVCLPFAIDLANTENNCEFYQLDGINGENITVSQINTTIPAGTPVIVKRTSGTDLKIFSPTDYASIVTQPVVGTGVNHLVGTFTKQELIKQNCYFIASDKFWQVTAKDAEGNTIKGVYVPPFRASITAAEGETLAQSLGIVIADETNGIGLTPTVEDLLSEKAEYFDLQGRRLDGPQKGINLVRTGGKTRKVVIK